MLARFGQVIYWAACGIALLLCTTAQANQVQVGKLLEFSLVYALPEPYREGKVLARIAPDQRRFSAIRVEIGGKKIEIPAHLFNDLDDPALDSMYLGYGYPTIVDEQSQKAKREPSFELIFDFGEKLEGDKCGAATSFQCQSTVHFGIADGRLYSRRIIRIDGSGEYVIFDRNLKPVPAGN